MSSAAWGFSIENLDNIAANIDPFRDCVSAVLGGEPVGSAVTRQLGSEVCYILAGLHSIEAVGILVPPMRRHTRLS